MNSPDTINPPSTDSARPAATKEWSLPPRVEDPAAKARSDYAHREIIKTMNRKFGHLYQKPPAVAPRNPPMPAPPATE